MLAGLRELSRTELEAFAKETQTLTPGASEHELLDGLLKWMGARVNAKGGNPAEIEKATLTWIGQRLEIEFPTGASVDDMEASLRRKIADESYEFLFPFLAVGSAVAYLGPRQVVGPKLELMEAASAALIPSHTAREKMRGYYQARGRDLLEGEGQLTPEALLEYFQETVGYLAQTELQTRISILILNYVVALSDGRYEQPEELFLQGLAEHLKVDRTEAERVRREVTETFWKQHTALGGGTYKSTDKSTGDELSINMQAAHQTLEASGGLASFNQEVEQGFVASIHRSMQKDSAMRRLKGSGALGFATGMLCYIKERWKVGEQEILMRLVLAAIFRQHLHATGDHAKITQERIEGYLPKNKVENVSDTMAETMVGKPAEKPADGGRRLSLGALEPESYPELT